MVAGTVTFRGTVPPGQEVPLTSDCHRGSGSRTIEVKPVLVTEGGGLSDVVVSLKGAVGGAANEPPVGGPVLLDQVGCEYVPHVVALRVGQVLTIRSSDATTHNVHSLPTANEAFNLYMTTAGEAKERTFTAPESFTVKCDVHNWMTASVNVFDHPFYAVTDKNGRYEIKGLPPGKHTLVFRHDFLGETEVEVEAREGGTVDADAVFGKQ